MTVPSSPASSPVPPPVNVDLHPGRLPGARTALLLVDLQNDFLAPDGAYARGGAAHTKSR